MNKISIKLKNSFTGEFKSLEIPSKECLLDILDNLDTLSIAKQMIDLAKDTNKDGTVYAEFDIEHLDLDIYWLKKDESPTYMYNKYVILMKLDTGKNSLLSTSDENLLTTRMHELYESILSSEKISLDKDTVFQIVLDFFKTTKRDLIKNHSENLISKVASLYNKGNIEEQVNTIYNI